MKRFAVPMVVFIFFTGLIGYVLFTLKPVNEVVQMAPKLPSVQGRALPSDVTKRTDADWKKILTPLQYDVLRQKGTEIPFTGALLHENRKGTYVTADCGTPVFRSEAKYDSGTGWPSFTDAIPDSIKLVEDTSLGEIRTEVVDAKCGSHLGHVFDDGPAPTGKRYCMNSAALVFIPDGVKGKK